MSEVSALKRNEPLKVVVALSFLSVVVFFFIMPLFAGKSTRSSRKPKRSQSHATADSRGPMARETGRHVIHDVEDGDAVSVDMLRLYGSWTATTQVKEVFAVRETARDDK